MCRIPSVSIGICSPWPCPRKVTPPAVGRLRQVTPSDRPRPDRPLIGYDWTPRHVDPNRSGGQKRVQQALYHDPPRSGNDTRCGCQTDRPQVPAAGRPTQLAYLCISDRPKRTDLPLPRASLWALRGPAPARTCPVDHRQEVRAADGWRAWRRSRACDQDPAACPGSGRRRCRA